jgi:hypothetical protein
MAYTAKVYRIMLASPSDVDQEKKIAREVIFDWNNINSESKNIVLLPIDWEFNTIPTMGERPQEIVNSTVLSKADLLIGIFWSRVGTPTGEFDSGTIEEIDKHIKTGKPTFLYFSKKNIPPDSINADQFKCLKSLKTNYQSKGITTDFDSDEDFRRTLSSHLGMEFNNDKYLFIVEDDDASMYSGNIYNENDLYNTLSEESKRLLIELSFDRNGHFEKNQSDINYSIETNNKFIVNDSQPRIRALWEKAIDDLENYGLIRDYTYNRDRYEITDIGYKLADFINQKVL